MYFLYLFKVMSKNIPRIPQDIISPIPTVTMKYGMEPSNWYTKASTKGMIRVLAIIGGSGANHLLALRKA